MCPKIMYLMSDGWTPTFAGWASIARSAFTPLSRSEADGPQYVGSVMTLSLSPVSKRMLPLGCLIRKNATGIMNFSLPVAAADNADLAISKGWEVNTYSFIPSAKLQIPATRNRRPHMRRLPTLQVVEGHSRLTSCRYNSALSVSVEEASWATPKRPQ